MSVSSQTEIFPSTTRADPRGSRLSISTFRRLNRDPSLRGEMSASGSMFIGIVGALVFLISVFTFSQRNWKGGLFWLLSGIGLIAFLTYMDKPSSNLWP